MVNVPPEDKQSKFMKNSKKFYKSPKTSRSYFQQSVGDEMVSTESHGENSSLIVEASAPPAIAIVAPTARNPSNHSISLNSSVAPCKAHGIPPPMPRTMHVQHHIHHIQPVQISTTLSPPPTQSQVNAPANSVQLSQPPPQTAPVWPVVEPAFHFGPGFEIHQSYCPTHSRPHADQHIVMFYLYPGVAASFQIAGGHKILQGESIFHLFSNTSLDSWVTINETKLVCNSCKMRIKTVLYSLVLLPSRELQARDKRLRSWMMTVTSHTKGRRLLRNWISRWFQLSRGERFVVSQNFNIGNYHRWWCKTFIAGWFIAILSPIVRFRISSHESRASSSFFSRAQ